MMKKLIWVLVLPLITSCYYYNRAKDAMSYKSITGRHANVMVTLAKELKEYKNAQIIYSDTDASTILIKTEEGKDVYIQGPAILEFSDESQF